MLFVKMKQTFINVGNKRFAYLRVKSNASLFTWSIDMHSVWKRPVSHTQTVAL